MSFNVSKKTDFCLDFKINICCDCISLWNLFQNLLWHGVSLLWPDVLPKLEIISLSLLQNKYHVVYRSGISFQIQNQLEQSPLAIAKQLINSFPKVIENSPEKPQLDITVSIVNDGFIDFQLKDQSMDIWLTFLSSNLSLFKSFPSTPITCSSDFNYFPIQYIHDRCCSLLLLGEREKIIQLKTQDFSQLDWQWLQPNPIPWSTASGNFPLVHPVERSLIHELITVVDAYFSIIPQNTISKWHKLTLALSKAILEFDRSCRIFGEVKQKSPQLSQARLGLIALAQFFLQSILQQKFNIIPLTE